MAIVSQEGGSILAPPNAQDKVIPDLAVSRLVPEELVPGAIYRQFIAGSKVVCLPFESKNSQIANVIETSMEQCSEVWQQSIFELAENHIKGDCYFGDMIRFAPGLYGHLARKIGFYFDEAEGEFFIFPNILSSNGQRFFPAPAALKVIWDFALEVLQSSMPDEIDPSDYAVTIEWLKYPNSERELDNLFHLVSDAAGGFAKLGLKVDKARARFRGPFSKRGIRGVLSFLALIPSFKKFLDKLNEKFSAPPSGYLASKQRLVAPPHYDGTRILTMLTGRRDVMTTQVFSHDVWYDVPVRSGTLSVMPGALYKEHTGVPASLHRYLIDCDEPRGQCREPNVTLLLGLVPRLMLQEASPGLQTAGIEI